MQEACRSGAAEQVRQGMAWMFVRYAPGDSPCMLWRPKLEQRDGA